MPGGSRSAAGIEIVPQVYCDLRLARLLDDLLHRTCDLARALTGADQAALKIELRGEGRAARKFFNLSKRYDHWSEILSPATDPGRGRSPSGVDDCHPPPRSWRCSFARDLA